MGTFKAIIDEIFHSIERALGVHVTLLLVERAVWKVREKYEEANLIRYSEEGINLEQLKDLEPSKANLITQEFITAFVATLSRLVGKQLASELTKQLEELREV
ncbi:MAG: hypothetical protein ACOYVD_10205 [Bacillota bacterium]